MTLVSENRTIGVGYIPEEKPSKVTRKGIQVITLMSTWHIIWFLLNKHRVGLWALTAIASSSYITYDKLVRLFI